MFIPGRWIASSRTTCVVVEGVNERRAADWFARYWCGQIKGRWLMANGGIAITGNNQGLESTWRWDRMAISQGYQVLGVWEN